MSQQPTIVRVTFQTEQPDPDRDLLARINAHRLDRQGVALPFSARLAQENGWPLIYARRVVKEYRRFIYLACIAGEEVTPSDEIDQAWHLHLAYSRDYWEEFCPNVLRRQLHHGPTEGGSEEDDRYKANYRRTLEIYEATFGELPPSDIWPPVSLRFGYYGTHFVRVNSALFQIAPRTDLVKSRLSGFGTALGLFLIVLILVLFSAILLHSTPLFAPVGGFWDLAGRLGLYAIGLFLWAMLLLMLAMNWFGRAEEKEVVARTLHGYTVGFAIGSLLPDVSYADASMTVTGISGDGGSDGGGDGGGGCGGGGCGGN